MSSSPITATSFLIAIMVMRSFVIAVMSRRLRHSIPIQEEEEDRISALPDSLLHHILSFLPTKDAAVTIILSKRWKPLFLSQLMLNFDENHFPNAVTFRNFVYSVLGRRDKTLPILQFHLKSHKSSRVFIFIRVAINKGVQNLTLDMNMSNLPPFVLTCKTLTVLNLKSVVLYSDQPVHLPSLKVLHIEYVSLQNHEYIWKILCGCPILEEFQTKDLQIFKTPSHTWRPVQVVHKGNKLCKAYWEDPDIVPECLLSHLTKCSLKIDSSLSWKFRFAKYIMQNSRVLNTMTIQCAKYLDTDAKDQMFMELSLCARNSAACQLLFI